MIERTAADWEALTREYGRVAGDLLTWQRVAAEREAELRDLREQLATVADRLYRPPDSDGGTP